jgi:hypothetical protein
MNFLPDKFEVLFFIAGIIITIPMLVLFQKLRSELKKDFQEKNKNLK